VSSRHLRALADHLRSIPLEEVLRLEPSARPDRYDRAKWHTARGVLSVSGAKFMNWSCAQGGGGAIDLVMHLHQVGFGPAVQWLSQRFGGGLRSPPAPDPLAPKAARLHLPPPAPAKLWRVRRYLLRERGLPLALIEPLIQAGRLYADERANAVFLLLGKENQPVGAELRGTTVRPWHGLAPGSQKDLGFFSMPPEPLPAIILVESAIDAISCCALHPHHRCISTAGARPNPGWLTPLLNPGSVLYCGFDADRAGETMAREMMALHPAIQRLCPPHHDWNDVLRARC
jgi:Toprim-like/Protein of unknown function (DUF3991)